MKKMPSISHNKLWNPAMTHCSSFGDWIPDHCFSDFKGAYAYADGAAPMEGAEQVLSHDAKAFEYYTLPVLYVFWKRRK